MNFFSSSSPKIIAVVGATGSQGGATVKSFHALAESGNNEFQVRAITRDPTSDKAKAIEPLVKEVVKADADDVRSMVTAFKGCYGAFLMSDFWQDMDVAHEMQVLRNFKEAVKEAGVKHVVLSTLESCKEYVDSSENKDTWKYCDEDKGMYSSHLDGKWEVTKEFVEEGIPVTPFLTCFYYENFINLGMGPSRQSDSDPYAITLPSADSKLQMVAVADIGKVACAIFQDPSLIGKTVGVRSCEMSVQEIADTFASICGVPVVYNSVPWDVYASFGFPGAEDLANMFRFMAEDEQTWKANRDDSDELLKVMGGGISLEEWITSNKHAFELKATPATEEMAPDRAERETAMSSPQTTSECCVCTIS